VKLEEKSAVVRDAFSLERARNGKGKNLSDGGQLAVALRTVLSSASATNIGMGLLEDFYHTTINRHIRFFAACLLQHSRSLSVEHKSMLEQCAAAAREEGSPCVQLRMVSFSSDATNSAVLHKSKLHTTEIYTISFPNAELINAEGKNAFSRYGVETYCLPDVQRVVSGSTESTYSLLKKQVGSLYLDLWPENFPRSDRPEDLVDFSLGWDREAEQLHASKHIPLDIWAYTSDGGSDQAKFKRVANAATMRCLTTLMIQWPCILHCGALISKSGLTMMDSFCAKHKFPYRFFSALAKIIYIWRDSIASFFKVWCQVYGAEEALQHTRSLPPTAISGRWGSVAAALRRLVPCQEDFRNVLRMVHPLTDSEKAAATAGYDLEAASDVWA
jgi:hypothetical protein